MDILAVFLIIFLFSVVQSVLGVGLLVFGTPTFLLLGLSFPETLSIVLPPSILMSFLQVLEGGASGRSFRREFNLYCLPFVLGGLLVALNFGDVVDLNILVGAMLVFSALVKSSQKLEGELFAIIGRFRRSYQVLMGIIHGLTNMGGGLLTIYSSSIHENRKVETRNGVAYGYLVMGLVQYATLIYSNPSLITGKVLSYVALSGATYLLLGKKIFHLTQQKAFHYFVTSVILFYGVTLLISS